MFFIGVVVYDRAEMREWTVNNAAPLANRFEAMRIAIAAKSKFSIPDGRILQAIPVFCPIPVTTFYVVIVSTPRISTDQQLPHG